ncbi:MAG TPA: MFS transporter [Actinomycetota bacterium]|nr:MFS transporter [Actinomycetota bacterium]
MRVPLLRALSQRDFAILWAGQTISHVGDGIFTVALAWQALRLSSGAGTLGAVLAIRSVTRVVILLVSGPLADRYQKRLLMLAGDLMQMAAVASIAYVAATGDVRAWQLAAAAGVTGAGSAVFLASSSAIVPELVEEEHFQSANSLRATSSLLAMDLVGPAIGGILVAAVGVAAAFAIDAATFLASITALLFVRPRRRAREQPSGGVIAEAVDGLRYVRRTPWIWVTLVAVGTIGNFVSYGPLVVLVPLFVENHVGGDAATLGFVLTGYGVGGVIGALTVGSSRRPLTSTVPAYAGWIGGAMFFGLLAFAPNGVVAGVILAAGAFCGEIAEVVWATLLQKFVPGYLLGRVTSTDWLVSLSLSPVGVGLAAPAAAAFGVRTTLIAGAVVATAAMLLALSWPRTREIEPVPAAG